MVTRLKPYNPSASEFVPTWHVIDAKDKVLGRLASEISMRLMGKDRPGYVPHLLSGDFVVVVNAAKVRLTGNKAQSKVYLRHSQKPGNLKEIPYGTVLEKFPERIIERSVRGMLPKNRLGVQMLKRMKVYAGEEHPHSAQLIGSERRVAAIAAGQLEAPARPATVRRRKPKVEKVAVAAAPESEAVEVAAEKPATKSAKAPAKTTAAKKAPAKKAPAKKAAADTEKKPAAAKTAGTKKTAAKPKESGSAAASKKSASKAAPGKTSTNTAARKSTTRPTRSTTTRKSGA